MEVFAFDSFFFLFVTIEQEDVKSRKAQFHFFDLLVAIELNTPSIIKRNV